MLVFSARYFGKNKTKPWLNHDQHFFYNGIPVISVLGNWIYNCSPLAFPSLSVPPKILEAWMASSLAGTSTKPIAGGGPANQETVRKMKRSQESCDYPPSKTKRITLQVVATPKYKSFQPNDFDYNPPIGRKRVTLHHLPPFFPVSYKVKLFGNKMFDMFDLLSCLAQHTFPNRCPFLKQRQLVEYSVHHAWTHHAKPCHRHLFIEKQASFVCWCADQKWNFGIHPTWASWNYNTSTHQADVLKSQIPCAKDSTSQLTDTWFVGFWACWFIYFCKLTAA